MNWWRLTIHSRGSLFSFGQSRTALYRHLLDAIDRGWNVQLEWFDTQEEAQGR